MYFEDRRASIALVVFSHGTCDRDSLADSLYCPSPTGRESLGDYELGLSRRLARQGFFGSVRVVEIPCDGEIKNIYGNMPLIVVRET